MTDLCTVGTHQFFHAPVTEIDAAIASLIELESERQESQLELIAPKNYMSRAVRAAHDSMLAFTSVEGYPGRRWHAGVVNLDEIERTAIRRAAEAFGGAHANVQPHSGTQANQAVFFAFLEPGDRVLSMALDAGGHLSHGLRSNLSGKWFDASFYGVRPDNGLIDYAEVARIAREVRPKMIICGGSSYPRQLDFAAFREIADAVDAYLLTDVAHIASLVVTGLHPSAFPHVDVLTATTNKSLRGPRGGLIVTRDAELGKKVDAGLFPGIQGGPLPEYTVAKAVALKEAGTPEFREYAGAVLENARVLAGHLAQRGYAPVTGGTDTPLVVIDLRETELTGDVASDALEAVGVPCNKNLVPGDKRPPTITSGVRFGTSGVTTRGLRAPDVAQLAELIADVLDATAAGRELPPSARRAVEEIAVAFPLYPDGQGDAA